MKYLLLILTLLLFSCKNPLIEDLEDKIEDLEEQIESEEAPDPVDLTELEEEIEELKEELESLNPENIPPKFTIHGFNVSIGNGHYMTLSVEIDDPDDFYFYYSWKVDGEEVSKEDNFSFSKSPEVETIYKISLTVSDGDDEVTDSLFVTVKEPPWVPEKLHVYFFAVGSTPDENNIRKFYVASSPDEYPRLFRATGQSLEIHNRDYDEKWFRVGGGI